MDDARSPTKVDMRYVLAALVLAGFAGLGCPAAGTPNQTATAAGAGAGQGSATGSPQGTPANAAAGTPAAGAATGGPALTPPDQVKPERRVYAYLDGHRRVMDIDEARAHGFTVVDLGDDWVPYIFWSKSPGGEDFKLNTYQYNYVALANDQINVDGAKLRRNSKNYLEVYGIPPSIGVVRKRFLADEKKDCYKSLDSAFFKQYYGPVKAADARSSKYFKRRYRRARLNFKRALRRARVGTVDELLAIPKYAKTARRYRRNKWRYEAIKQMQKRLVCEGMFKRRRPRVKWGVVNWATRIALRKFERKHNVYGWGMIFQRTATALGRTHREANYESLRRVIAERIVSATGILEDGSVRGSYVGEDGQRHRVGNLVKQFADVALKQMGLTDADKAREWITKHSAAEFKHMFVAVKLPKLPEYYSNNMDFQVVINRGDVWYELPFNDKGKRKRQPRGRMPRFHLYVKYKGQRIPLVRWRTTIGGWNKEMRHGEEYYKYKISDVGKRIWRNIVAGPAWVPPKKTPPSDLVKYRYVAGRAQRVVAQSTFGPGYASAYGLAAAYHIEKRSRRDNQIRTHGSVNYMSIRGSYSHGCHRLYNFAAVRLFSFILRHRPFTRVGQRKIGYRNRFEHKGEEFQINLHTRGYFYELTPPVPVNVLKGRIRGKRKEPHDKYVKKPGKVYQSDVQQQGGGAKRKGSMSQEQPL